MTTGSCLGKVRCPTPTPKAIDVSGKKEHPDSLRDPESDGKSVSGGGSEREEPVEQVISAASFHLAMGCFVCCCMGLGILVMGRKLPTDLNPTGVPFQWNGYTAMLCDLEAVPPTRWASLLKRFEVEPYSKIFFRIALMFPAMARFFLVLCRSEFVLFVVGRRASVGCVLHFLARAMPFAFVVQMVCAALFLITNGRIDANPLPGLHETAMHAFVGATLVYMLLVVLLDGFQAGSLSALCLQTRFLVRLVMFGLFLVTAAPVLGQMRQFLIFYTCHNYADGLTEAALEYLAIGAVTVFHISELFDLSPMQFHIVSP